MYNCSSFAVLLVPTLDIKAVVVVPILSPNSIGNAISRPISPWEAKACNKPMEALLLCNIVVNPSPTNIPRKGSFRLTIIFEKNRIPS